MSNPLVELAKTGQSIWYDQMERRLITTGKLKKMIEEDDLGGRFSRDRSENVVTRVDIVRKHFDPLPIWLWYSHPHGTIGGLTITQVDLTAGFSPSRAGCV